MKHQDYIISDAEESASIIDFDRHGMPIYDDSAQIDALIIARAAEISDYELRV
jgi:hypothetical protein